MSPPKITSSMLSAGARQIADEFDSPSYLSVLAKQVITRVIIRDGKVLFINDRRCDTHRHYPGKRRSKPNRMLIAQRV